MHCALSPRGGSSAGRMALPSGAGDALWNAVSNKDLREVQQCLRRGADPNTVCTDSWVKDECAGRTRRDLAGADRYASLQAKG